MSKKGAKNDKNIETIVPETKQGAGGCKREGGPDCFKKKRRSSRKQKDEPKGRKNRHKQ